MQKILLWGLSVSILFSNHVRAGKIVYPWRSTTAIVKAGETFEVWLDADPGQTVTSVTLRGPYNTVTASMDTPASGTWVYDEMSGNTYNRKIAVAVPATAPADRYDLVLTTSTGEEISFGGVKVVTDYKSDYYIMHMSDGHLYQSGYNTDTLLARKSAMIDIANIIDAQIIIETGDNMYNVRNHPEREGYYFLGNAALGTKGMSDAHAATYLVPGDHDAYLGNDWPQTNAQVNADFFNDYWGMQNHCFKYGQGRFMTLNNAWAVSDSSAGGHQYQIDDAVAWLGGAGSGGSFFLTAGHCYDKMHEFIDTYEPLDLVLAGDKHHVRTDNPWPFDTGSAEVAYIAGSIRDHFEFNLYKVNDSAGTFTTPAGPTAVANVLYSGNQDTPSTWVPNLTLTYSKTNNGTFTENTATLVNKFVFPIIGARVRFVMPPGSSCAVSMGTIQQAFDGDSVHVVDVSVDLGANSTTVVDIFNAGSLNNHAQFISQSAPAVMEPGQTYPVSITMKNTGMDPWSTAAGHSLGSQNLPGNTTWGLDRVPLTGTVETNQQVPFTFNVTAPSEPGLYNFQWRMVDDLAPDQGWFGQLTSNMLITVGAQDIHIEAEDFAVNSGFLSQPTTDIGGGLNMGWTDPGDYLTYNVNITHSGTYDIRFRLASATTQMMLDLKDGSTVICSVDEPTTGGNQNWVTVTNTVHLESGPRTLTILAKSKWNINWFEIIAIGNAPPVFTSSPGLTAQESSPYTYTVTTSDLEGDAVSLSGITIPSWLGFNTNTGVLSGTPTASDIGSHPVTLRASDQNKHFDQHFTISVGAIGNDAPVIHSIPHTGVIENQAFSYTLSSTDVDGDELTYAGVTVPSWLSFDVNSGGLSGIPASADKGLHLVALTVHDGTVTVTQQFNIAVFATPISPNLVQNGSFELGGTAPTSWTLGGTAAGSGITAQDGNTSMRISAPSTGAFARQTIAIQNGTTYTLSVWINSAGISGASAVFDTFDQYDATCQFAIGANGGWTKYTGTFTAINNSVTLRIFAANANFAGAAYFDNVILMPANAPNVAPVITSVPVTNAVEGVAYSYTLLAADAENNALVFTAVNMPSWLSFDANSRMLTGIPTGGDAGSHPVTLRVSDGLSTADQSFSITVAPTAISGYAAWAAIYGIGGEYADADEDGRNNFYEYVLGGNPTGTVDVGTEPTFAAGSNAFEYIHLQRRNDPYLTYRVEICTNLADGVWTTDGTWVMRTNVTGGAYDEVVNGIPATNPVTCVRLKVISVR